MGLERQNIQMRLAFPEDGNKVMVPPDNPTYALRLV